MVASVLIREKNTAGETPTDKTSGEVRFKLADDAVVDLNNPIVIPAAGQEHSYEKWLRMQIGGTGPNTQITNLNVYTDTTNGLGTGVNLYFETLATFATPVIPSNANAIPLHAAVPMVDIFTLSSGAPQSLGAGPYSSTNTDMGDYLILAMTAANTASPGVTPTETITFSYDEI